MNNKFRGQRTDTKEWVYGNLLKLETDYFTDSNDTGFMWYIIPLKTNGSWSKEKLMLKFISPCFEVVPETIGQYTGLTDKNGKEIFEGDILTSCYPFKDGGEPNYNAEVFWSEGSLRFCTELHCVNPNKAGISDGICEGLTDIDIQYEIIGNIYDNSELIKVNNED